jgi:hypothetical protein
VANRIVEVFGIFDKVHIAEQVIQELQHHVDLQKLTTYCDLQIHSVCMKETSNREIISEYMELQQADLATLLLAQQIQPDWCNGLVQWIGAVVFLGMNAPINI